jgi:glycerophosphoryl diester phosphodiesterase
VDEKTGVQSPSAEQLISKAKAAKLEGINVSYKGLGDRAFLDKIKAAGLELFTWTVNSPDVARSLAKLGINGITTDRPAWLRRELSK